MDKPRLLKGDIIIDDRGEVGFVNEFTFDDIKRCYLVTNHKSNFVRAWHAHKKEGKYVTVVNGAAIIAAVKIDNWENPSKNADVFRYVLSAIKPAVLFIPKGYANGFMSLKKNTKVMFFSTATLEESQDDDIRYDARLWDPWKIVER